ncbi:MAG: isoprenylcysteine carboxylmethyltransferase family protein [Candidatus Neomarinimicrobiota bacterium]
MKNLIGKATINPLLFYSGKISGYVLWILLLQALLSTGWTITMSLQKWITVIGLFIGLTFTVISLINLGKSTCLGIPGDTTAFKTNGLYRISRNPMYLGFNLLTLSAVLYLKNFPVLIFGIYSIVIYHRIILGEEKFLENRFAEQYIKYRQRVRRYI